MIVARYVDPVKGMRGDLAPILANKWLFMSDIVLALKRISGYAYLLLPVIVALTAPMLLADSWIVSCIGDEWGIYERARRNASGEARLFPEIFGPLSAGMWGVHKPFLTLCQGLLMSLFGINNFGWRMATIVPFALSIVPFAILVELLVSRRMAFIAAMLMAVSYYLVAESLWGYGWTLLRFFSLMAFAALGVFLTRPTILRGIALGVSLTGCSLSGALCTYITPLTFLVLFVVAWKRGGRRVWFLSGIVFLVYVTTHTLPIKIFGSSDPLATTMQLTLAKTAAGPVLRNYFGSEMFPKVEGAAQTTSELVVLVGRQFVQTLVAPVFYRNNSHYVFGAPLDIATAVLSLFGSLLVIWMACRSWKWRLVLLFYLPAVMLAGALSPYARLPITRIHFLMPFWILFAVAGLDLIARVLGRRSVWLLGLAVVGFSAWTGYYHTFVKLPGTPKFTNQVYAVQLLQSLPNNRLAFLFADWHPLEFVVGPYGLSGRVIQVKGEEASHAKLREVSRDSSTLIVLEPGVSAQVLDTVRAEKCRQDSGKCNCSPCGGFPGRSPIVCGSFECTIEQPRVISAEQW